MSKQTIWLTYRDVADYPRKSFERLAAPPAGAALIKPGVIPGQPGYKDIYVNWEESTRGDLILKLVTYTEAPLSVNSITKILANAFKFAGQQ